MAALASLFSIETLLLSYSPSNPAPSASLMAFILSELLLMTTSVSWATESGTVKVGVGVACPSTELMMGKNKADAIDSAGIAQARSAAIVRAEAVLRLTNVQ